MGKDNFFLSICIPSYNRPKELKRALESIDVEKHADDIEIVICEDFAPKRIEVRKVVDEFKKQSPYVVNYVENEVNYGHGKNWRQCSKQSHGEYLIYMGDDDAFIKGALDTYIDWLLEHRNLGYVLRSYINVDDKGKLNYFRYYSGDKVFEPGVKPYTEFFYKSVLMSGYTIKREYALPYTTDELDGTLFFQLYLLAEVCLRYPSGYCNTPIAQWISDGTMYFGTNAKEKELYTPGKSSASNPHILDNFFKISQYIDKEHGIESTSLLKKELSKYIYPYMSMQRKYGMKHMNAYCKELKKMGLAITPYFYIYYVGLTLFGEKNCQRLIDFIKKIVGRRLHL